MVFTSSSPVVKLDDKGSVRVGRIIQSVGRINESRNFGVDDRTATLFHLDVEQDGRLGRVNRLSSQIGPGLNGNCFLASRRLCGNLQCGSCRRMSG